MTDVPHDPKTGEILDDTDASGEDARALTARDGYAADGLPVKKRSGHLADVLRMLEDGQFNADVSEEMRDLAQAIDAHAHNNKGVAKGSMTIQLDLSQANGVLVITGTSKIKKPVQKRGGTALFIGEDGSLGRNPPGQSPMFGERKPRDPYDERKTRDV